MTARAVSRLALVLAAVIALASATAGCGLFDTAQPEPPSGFQAPPADFTLPESLIVTLERSIELKIPSNYGLCFADTLIEDKGFHASFDPADIQDYLQTHPAPPADWIRPQELSFFSQFIGSLSGTPNAVISIDDERGGVVPISATRQIWNVKFRVFLGQNAATASAAGLQIERVNLAGDWKITHWEDRRDTTNVPSYGTRRLNGR